ncbi:MAG: hypothetical protein Q4P66_01245 [Actinomycetaceae bacterium]|nr:hypothetical protein [Actinomycetaceae bacterium]
MVTIKADTDDTTITVKNTELTTISINKGTELNKPVEGAES